jgi:hypothetical protein
LWELCICVRIATKGVCSGPDAVRLPRAFYLRNSEARRGAKVNQPVKDQFYGDRSATLEDPFGHVWTIATPAAPEPSGLVRGPL